MISDDVTREDVESWLRYFDEHADEFVAAHAAIIQKTIQSDAARMTGREMTNEKRQKLVESLGYAAAYHNSPICDVAAEEIKRLAEQVKWLINAKPVAWRWRWQHDPPNEWHFAVNEFHGEHNIIIEPLYTARPQPSYVKGDFARYAKEFNKELGYD